MDRLHKNLRRATWNNIRLFSDVNTFYFNLQINWTATVETLLRATGLSEQERSALLLSDMPVSLQCRDFLPELGTLLSTTSARYLHRGFINERTAKIILHLGAFLVHRRTVTNYLIWRFVFKSMPLITTRFQKMWTNFKQSVPNLGEERIYLTRWVYTYAEKYAIVCWFKVCTISRPK